MKTIICDSNTKFNKFYLKNLFTNELVELKARGYTVIKEKDTIDGYMDLLYDVLNEKKEYITISGNKMPVNIVWGRLEKLYYEHILYCMEQMGKQTTRIHNTKEYKKKLLYEAYTQMNDDITNQVQHDMYWGTQT